jgi:hypothetical protein
MASKASSTSRNGNSARNSARNSATGRPQSLQGTLTETTFANYLDGFTEVTPRDLLQAKGGRVRYVIETLGPNGRVAARDYRLGGWLAKVDPALRFLRLFNPYAKKAWSVQLEAKDKAVRLYYMPQGTSDEVATLRRLLEQMETGKIRITRTGA